MGVSTAASPGHVGLPAEPSKLDSTMALPSKTWSIEGKPTFFGPRAEDIPMPQLSEPATSPALPTLLGSRARTSAAVASKKGESFSRLQCKDVKGPQFSSNERDDAGLSDEGGTSFTWW